MTSIPFREGAKKIGYKIVYTDYVIWSKIENEKAIENEKELQKVRDRF